jgi:hypothetical protein
MPKELCFLCFLDYPHSFFFKTEYFVLIIEILGLIS